MANVTIDEESDRTTPQGTDIVLSQTEAGITSYMLLSTLNTWLFNGGGASITLHSGATMDITGGYSLGITLSANTALTFPTSGTVTALGNITTGTGSIVLASGPIISNPTINSIFSPAILNITPTSGTVFGTPGGVITNYGGSQIVIVSTGSSFDSNVMMLVNSGFSFTPPSTLTGASLKFGFDGSGNSANSIIQSMIDGYTPGGNLELNPIGGNVGIGGSYTGAIVNIGGSGNSGEAIYAVNSSVSTIHAVNTGTFSNAIFGESGGIGVNGSSTGSGGTGVYGSSTGSNGVGVNGTGTLHGGEFSGGTADINLTNGTVLSTANTFTIGNSSTTEILIASGATSCVVKIGGVHGKAGGPGAAPVYIDSDGTLSTEGVS